MQENGHQKCVLGCCCKLNGWVAWLLAWFHFLIACNGRKASVAIFAVKGACDEIVEGIASSCEFEIKTCQETYSSNCTLHNFRLKIHVKTV